MPTASNPTPTRPPTLGPSLGAALRGFRLSRERPRVLAVWAVVCLVFSLAEGAFVAATAGSGVMAILRLAQQPRPDPDEVLARLTQIAPTYLVLVVATAVFNAMFLAAANRAVFRPAEDRAAYLGAGREELLQLGLVMATAIVGMTVYLAMVVVASVLGAGLALAGAAPLAVPVAVVVVVAGVGYVWVRLSLASPLTFARGRIDLFGSWILTRGRVWPVARVYLLALALVAVVYLLGLTLIVTGLSAALGGVPRFIELAQPDLGSLTAFLTPPRLALTVLQAALTALILPVALCPAIEVYRTLTARPDVGGQGAPSPDTPWG